MTPDNYRPLTPTRTGSPDSDDTAAVYVLILTYRAPLSAIDATLPEHRRFLDHFFATGEFLASGPRQPRTGGVILASVASRARVDELIASDPFTQQQLAEYQVVRFTPTRGPLALPLREPTTAT